MRFDVKHTGNKTLTGTSLITLIKSPATKSSGVSSTRLLSCNSYQLCDRIKLLLREKEGARFKSNMISGKLFAVADMYYRRNVYLRNNIPPCLSLFSETIVENCKKITRFTHAETSAINSTNSEVNIKIPSEDSVSSLINGYLESKSHVVKSADNTGYANGNDI